jgi:hypothetical protein
MQSCQRVGAKASSFGSVGVATLNAITRIDPAICGFSCWRASCLARSWPLLYQRTSVSTVAAAERESVGAGTDRSPYHGFATPLRRSMRFPLV